MNKTSYTEFQYKLPQNDFELHFSYNNAFSPTANSADIYNTQNAARSQQSNYSGPIVNNAYQDPMDVVTWENKTGAEAQKVMKMHEKADINDVNAYDLFVQNQWCPNQVTQSNLELPSCAEAQAAYSGIERTQEVNSNMKICGYNTDNNFPEATNMFYKNMGYKSDVWAEYYPYNYCDKYQETQSLIPSANFLNIPFAPIIDPIHNKTEDSNEGSEIIVEESDDEVTDYSEDQDKRVYSETNKCIVCNLPYTPFGTQFYYLTSESPLTMSTQKPVLVKIIEIVGSITTTRNYICSECLGLINSMDHLQLKLKNLTAEFVTKFEKSCKDNEIPVKQTREVKKQCAGFKKYKCKLCKLVICMKTLCFRHLQRHKVKIYLCELCGTKCLGRKKLTHHLKTHTVKKCSKINAFHCETCAKTFRTKSNLREHVNYCSGSLPFNCKFHYCDKKFASATKLKNHVKLKHDKKFIAICSICNIGFVKVSDYKSHMICHSTDKKHKCPKCYRTYKTLSNLNFHMKIHEKNLPYVCPLCQKGYMRKEYLEAHLNKHNGIKNHSCTVCDKRFGSQKNLDAHLKYHEGTVKRHTCNVCGKTMGSGFEEHLQSHNNLKEFECEKCKMRFNTKGTLNKHIKRKHVDVDLNK